MDHDRLAGFARCASQTNQCDHQNDGKSLTIGEVLERETRLELAASTLARLGLRWPKALFYKINVHRIGALNNAQNEQRVKNESLHPSNLAVS
jgi:hypothetical protein